MCDLSLCKYEIFDVLSNLLVAHDIYLPQAVIFYDCYLITGLSGAGKSTLAHEVVSTS